jgi:hypothetical protein
MDINLFDKKQLNQFGKDYVKILTIYLKKAGKKSTGALINSIDYRLQETASEINLIILSNDYLTYVDQGRKPGSFPPIKEIAKWASVNGIAPEAVYPIARNIFKFGIKPTNVIQKTIKEIETSPSLNKKYEEALIKNVENILIEKFNDIDKNN